MRQGKAMGYGADPPTQSRAAAVDQNSEDMAALVDHNSEDMASVDCRSNGDALDDVLDKLLIRIDDSGFARHDCLMLGRGRHSSQAKPTKSILKKDDRVASFDDPSSIFWDTDTSNSRSNSSVISSASTSRRVSFDSVDIRSYDRCAGDNPSCKHGVPVGFQERVAHDCLSACL